MTSNFSVDAIPPFRRRKKRDSLHVPPKKESRLDGYQTAKGGKGNDEAGDDKKHIHQSVADRQGSGRNLLSIEILARLFPDLELKAGTNQSNQPITRQQFQYLAKLKIDASPFDKRLATKFLNHVRARHELGLASIGQLRVLVSFGVPEPEWIGFTEAQQLIRSRFSDRTARYAAKDFICLSSNTAATLPPVSPITLSEF
jgi:hypothetical protein